MPLSYYPRIGEIVICRFEDRVIEPEMRKTRPAVVIGPRLRRRGGLATVIPLSTTAPIVVERYHCRIALDTPLPAPFDAPVMWGKCDMVAVVSLDRLDRFKESRARHGGARQWRTGFVSADRISALQAGLLCALGLESLTIQA